jgi:hypothetical protein
MPVTVNTVSCDVKLCHVPEDSTGIFHIFFLIQENMQTEIVHVNLQIYPVVRMWQLRMQ